MHWSSLCVTPAHLQCVTFCCSLYYHYESWNAASKVTAAPHVQMPHYFITAASQSQVIFFAYQNIWPHLFISCSPVGLTLNRTQSEWLRCTHSVRSPQRPKNGASGCANQPEVQREHPNRRELREQQRGSSEGCISVFIPFFITAPLPLGIPPSSSQPMAQPTTPKNLWFPRYDHTIL